MIEKREKPRVEFRASAQVRAGGRTIEGEITDLSMKGMFLLTSEPLSAGTEVQIKINLSGSTTDLFIEIGGVAERCTPQGIGFRFKEMELDSFIHLRNVVFYSDRELQEFYEFM